MAVLQIAMVNQTVIWLHLTFDLIATTVSVFTPLREKSFFNVLLIVLTVFGAIKES